jgi:DNA polymerase III subunit epsilon
VASDALATANLMFASLDVASQSVESASVNGEFQRYGFRSLSRAAVGGDTIYSSAILSSRQASLPSALGAELEYLEMLDRVLRDAHISPDEATILSEQVKALGLSEQAVIDLHSAYLRNLIEAVERDGVVTDEEFALMRKVASALALDDGHLPAVSGGRSANSTLAQGLKVCFTGEAAGPTGEPLERSDLEAMAESVGLVPVNTLTKKNCDALIASDPNSASGKAEKARRWGKPIFSIDEFLAFVNETD